MIKDQNKIFIRVQIIADIILVIIAFFLGYYLRDQTLDIYPISLLSEYLTDNYLRSLGYYAIYIGLLPVLVVIWVGLLHYFGMYKYAGVPSITDAVAIIIKTTIVGFILFGSYVFVLRMQEDISRLFVGFTFITAASLICIEKIILVYFFKLLVKTNKSFKSSLISIRRILVVGTNKRTKKFIDLVNNNPDWGITIIGLIDIDPERINTILGGHKVIGSFEDMPEIINNKIVDEIVFIVPRNWLNKIEDMMLYCESAGLKVNLAVNLFELKFSKAKQTDLQGFPLLTFETTTAKMGHLFAKRVFDFVCSAIGLILLIPFFIVISIIIKLTSEGPVFFKQERCTLYGRRFMFYKFRTMIVDAEEKLNELIKYNEMDGPVFKMTNDPRVTKIGKFLRKSSIDELPQLWNVLKGDMSLVGPRPPLIPEVENYDIWQRRRLSMRPGITCIWQSCGRNKIADFKEWMRLDLEYIDNWSFWLDIKILFKTIPVVLFGIGAK